MIEFWDVNTLTQKTNPLETWSTWITSFSQILFISPFTKLIFCIDSKIMCIFDNNKMLRRFRIIIYTICIHEFVWMGFFFPDGLLVRMIKECGMSIGLFWYQIINIIFISQEQSFISVCITRRWPKLKQPCYLRKDK